LLKVGYGLTHIVSLPLGGCNRPKHLCGGGDATLFSFRRDSQMVAIGDDNGIAIFKVPSIGNEACDTIHSEHSITFKPALPSATSLLLLDKLVVIGDSTGHIHVREFDGYEVKCLSLVGGDCDAEDKVITHFLQTGDLSFMACNRSSAWHIVMR